MKLVCEVPGSSVDEIFTKYEILDHIKRDNIDLESDTEQLYKFQHISTAHKGPLYSSDKTGKAQRITC
jgi:hypothetical protein